jgi:hypothetical protein
MYNARKSVASRHRAPNFFMRRSVQNSALHFFSHGLPGFLSRAPIVDDVNSPARHR